MASSQYVAARTIKNYPYAAVSRWQAHLQPVDWNLSEVIVADGVQKALGPGLGARRKTA